MENALTGKQSYYIVSGGGDGNINIWQLNKDLKLYQILVSHEYLSFCQFSPDKSILGTCGNDRMLRIWNVKYLQGAKQNKLDFDQTQLIRFKYQVLQVGFDFDNTYFAVELIYHDITRSIIQLYQKSEQGQYVEVLEIQKAMEIAMGRNFKSYLPEFSKYGNWMLIGFFTKKSGKQTAMFKLTKIHKGSPKLLVGHNPVISQDQQHLATTDDGCIMIYQWDHEDYKNVQQIQILKGLKGNVLRPLFTSDSSKLIAADSEGFLGIWNLISGQVIQTLETRGSRLNFVNMSISADDRYFTIALHNENKNNLQCYSLQGDEYVKFQSVAAHKMFNEKIEKLIQTKGEYVNSATLMKVVRRHENIMFTGSMFGSIEAWKINEFEIEPACNVGLHKEEVNDMYIAQTKNGRYLFTVSTDYTALIFKQRDKQATKYDPFQSIKTNEKLVKVAAHPNNQYVCFMSKLQMYFLKQNQYEEFEKSDLVYRNSKLEDSELISVMFSPNGKVFALSYLYRETSKGGSMTGKISAYSEDNAFFSVIEGNSVKVYNEKNLNLKCTISQLKGTPELTEFTSNNQYILIADDQGNLNLFNAQNGSLDQVVYSFLTSSCCCFVSQQRLSYFSLSEDNLFIAAIIKDQKKENCLIFKYGDEDHKFHKYKAMSQTQSLRFQKNSKFFANTDSKKKIELPLENVQSEKKNITQKKKKTIKDLDTQSSKKDLLKKDFKQNNFLDYDSFDHL